MGPWMALSPAPGATTKRGDPKRSVGPRWGQAFLVSFSATGKRNSRVRRETKTFSARGNVENQNFKGESAVLALGFIVVFFTACAELFYFAPYARLTFSIAGLPDHPKVSKRSSPHLGFSLCENSPRYVVVPGAGEKGHPWPSRLSRLPAAQPLPRRLRSACAQGAGRSRSKADQKRIKSGSKALGRPGGLAVFSFLEQLLAQITNS